MKKSLLTFIAIALVSMANAQGLQNPEANHVLNRFLNYVKIESQSIDDPDPESFPLTEGQKEMANLIFNELKTIDKDNVLDIKMSPNYFVYAKVSSNIEKEVPSVMFMAHMDVTPEANANGIRPQVHHNYDGGDIALGNGLVLSPNNPEGSHLKDVVGKTIVTTDGNTLLGSDCKAGCTILVTLIEQMVNDPSFKHGDVYFTFTQNEEVDKDVMGMDLSYYDRTPDILIDVDGSYTYQFSVANFTAEGRTYLFKGNQVHPAKGKAMRYADARTAMAYFIGQLPPEIHPSYSEGHQGYVHCYNIEMLPNGHDVRIRVRIRYFDKADGERFKANLDEAYRRTLQAYPFVEIDLENDELQYENIAYTMHPQAVGVIQRAAEKIGIPMRGFELRAGTTSASMVAKGLPGGPCLYSAQQASHSVYEWCCLEEILEIIRLTSNIVTEVSNLE
jgi:tripeptide aminopeptidase